MPSLRDMTPAERAAFSSKGGKAAHEQGLAHRWNSESAKAAGRKGGIACHAAKRRRQEAADEPEKG